MVHDYVCIYIYIAELLVRIVKVRHTETNRLIYSALLLFAKKRRGNPFKKNLGLYSNLARQWCTSLFHWTSTTITDLQWGRFLLQTLLSHPISPIKSFKLSSEELKHSSYLTSTKKQHAPHVELQQKKQLNS